MGTIYQRVAVPRGAVNVKNPHDLAVAGGAGTGAVVTANRVGFGPPGTGTESTSPIFGPVGAEFTGAESALVGSETKTPWPSQFAFPVTKYRNEAFGRGMTAGG